MKIFATLLALLASAAAFAETTVSFDTPTSCSTYCSGYTTYSSEHAVSYVTDAPYKVTVGFDGVTYSGPGVEVPVTSGDPYTATISGAVLQSADGRQITFNGVVLVKRTVVNSGRAHYTITRHNVQNGTVTF